MSRPTNGAIVLVDWRRGGLPKELTKLRPSIVVEDSRIFAEEHLNLIVMPVTTNADLALAFDVTSVSRGRIRPTNGGVTGAHLHAIRQKIGICLGLS